MLIAWLEGDGPETYCDRSGCFAREGLYKALARARSFKIIGPSRFGGELAIEYSPQGFVQAFQRMDSQCAKGRIGTWLR